jgi:PAS domain S-box-containing protein
VVSLKTLARLLEIITSRGPLATSLDELLRFSELLSPAMHCSILLADTLSGVLRHCAAPSLSPAYTLAIDKLPIAEGIGACGTAAARRETVIVSDIAQSPLWEGYKELAAAHNLRACWSVPLIDSEGTLLGTCAMYYSEPRKPTTAEEDAIRITGGLAALVIQRHRDAEQLHKSEARYRQLAETGPDAVIAHVDGRILYANSAAAKLLHVSSPGALMLYSMVQFVSPENQGDLLTHRAGVSAVSLHRSDGTHVNVEIAASEMRLDDQTVTLLVCRDVTERMALEDELLNVSSREQARLAHDLHDGLGQQLTGLSLFVRGLANQVIVESPKYKHDFDGIEAMVKKSIEDTRRLAAGMSPVAIEGWGLAEALFALGVQARDLYALKVMTSLEALQGVHVEQRVATQLYRIVQEAVGNVARHAHATTLTIEAQIVRSELQLTIADDGTGFAQLPAVRGQAEGLGLRIMRYRAQRIGGRFKVAPKMPRGTIVQVSCPFATCEREGGFATAIQ